MVYPLLGTRLYSALPAWADWSLDFLMLAVLVIIVLSVIRK